MEVPITYIPGFVDDPDGAFSELWAELAWERRDNVPRREYYVNDFVDAPYKYGRGAGERVYLPRPWHPRMETIRRKLEDLAGVKFDTVFANGYDNQRDHLGWHADDSDVMDDARPIGIVSLGVEREIWFCPCEDRQDVTRLKLGHGSLCLMHLGMQDTHLHRIPKAGFDCGERISLTYRGFVRG